MKTNKPVFNTLIKWTKLPDDKKSRLLEWINKYNELHPERVEFTYTKAKAIISVKLLISIEVRDNIREHTNTLAIISL